MNREEFFDKLFGEIGNAQREIDNTCAAEQIYHVFYSFVRAGFTREEALNILLKMIEVASDE